MKRFLILICSLTMVFFMNTTVNAQSDTDSTEHAPRFKYTNFDHMVSKSVVSSKFYTDRIMWEADSAMVEALYLQSRFERRFTTGVIISAVGIGGIIYTLNLPTPVFQDNNPTMNEGALVKRRNRRIAGAISGVVTAVGGILIIDSFKFNQRMEANLGLNELKLRFFLDGKRDYLKGKKKYDGKQYFRGYSK